MGWISLRDNPHEFIITIGPGIKLERKWWEQVIHLFSSRSTDLELFFSIDIKEWNKADKAGVTLTHVIHFPNINTTWEDVATTLQLWPSKGQARKNGWNGQIPNGYSEMIRRFHKFYILKMDT